MNGEIKITTRCPSYHNQTLLVDKQGYLFCTWLECQEPAMIHLIGDIDSEFKVFKTAFISSVIKDIRRNVSYLDCFATDCCKATTEQIKP